jgi:CBS domain-containing protein|uniref:CBS domain-containing protein n=1 Tax=Desulfobacca acetoxidans TaxID=60893 RepID=A0A7C5AKT8_9BACT
MKEKKVRDVMIPLADYPHIPYWFTLRQAMAMVREATLKFEKSFEPRSVLVFDEKYQLMGMLTLRDIVKGLEPQFLKGTRLAEGLQVASHPELSLLIKDCFGPGLKEASQRPVSEAMRPIRATVNAGDSLVKAMAQMIREDVGLMPVMEDQKVVGIVRLSDLFQEISRIVLGD